MAYERTSGFKGIPYLGGLNTPRSTGLGNFWKHCGPALQTCEAEKLKANKAVDELDSFYNRRGTSYLPQKSQEYYKAQIDAFRAEITNNSDCMKPGCGSPTSIFKSVAERATARLSEMQADIDMAAIKQEEERVAQAAQAQAAEQSLMPDSGIMPDGSFSPLPFDPATFVADNKMKLIVGGAALAAVIGLVFIIT